MKKILFLAAIAALAVGCDFNEQPIERMSEDAVRFYTTSTKAFESMDPNNIKSLAVFGEWVDDSNVLQSTNQFDFAYNKHLGRATNGGSTWSYEPTLYWPTSGNVNFYAYHPFASVNVTNFAKTATTPTFDYVNPDNATATAKHQEDLLVAAVLGQNKTTAPSGVNISLYHALTQVRFVGKNSIPNMNFEIEEIRILNLDNTAKFNLATVAETGNADGYAAGRPLPAAWSDIATANQTVDHYALETAVVGAGVSLPYSTAVGVYKKLGDAFTIIPQPIDSIVTASWVAPGTDTPADNTIAAAALTAAKATGKQVVALKYRIYNADGTIAKYTTWQFFNIDLNKVGFNGSLTPAITANQFVMGARYTFVFDFNNATDPDLMTPISFNVVGVDGWNDTTNYVVL